MSLEADYPIAGNLIVKAPFLDIQQGPIWNSVDATFDKQFLPYISVLPAIVTGLVMLTNACRIWILKWPQWIRPFVQEQPRVKQLLLPIKKRRLSFAAIGLLVLSIVGFFLRAFQFLHDSAEPLYAILLFPWATLVSFILVSCPVMASKSLLVIYSSIVVSELALLLHSHPASWLQYLPLTFEIVAALSAIALVLCMPLRSPDLPVDQICSVWETPTQRLRSPEDNLKPWQFMTVSWVNPLMTLGRRRQLNDADVWSLGLEFQHRRLHDAFRELQGTVLRRLLEANGVDLAITGFLGIIEMIANYTVPLLLQQLLQSLENPYSPRRAAVTYAVLSLLARFLASQIAVFSIWFCRRCYERSRGEMITMLFEKTLSRKVISIHPASQVTTTVDLCADDVARDTQSGKMSIKHSWARFVSSSKKRINSISNKFREPHTFHVQNQPASTGKILNLMRNDVYEVAQRFWEFPSLITNPLGLIFAVVLIWRLMGWPCLIGVLTILIAQVANALVVRSLLRWERLRRKATDTKLQAISDFVLAIRHLRWYSWEGPWLDKILDKRQRELRLRVLTGVWKVLISFTNQLASGMFPVVAFYAYTYLAGQPLRIDIAFPALQLFGMLEQSVREIPNLIAVLLNASIAVRRIEDFMAEPDQSSDVSIRNSKSQLKLMNASFAWTGTKKLVLLDVSLTFPHGLTVIYGQVGSGKTALLLACLGELDLLDGELTLPGESVGYCAQSPWLQSMSIRENILFHTPYEESRYRQVIEACALTLDFANFKYGDLSMIGENGVGLSGGQRIRIALARAVYSRTNLLLLDDPLSALDHLTAQTIVRRCLQGPLMENRAIVLVTHRTELCFHIAIQVVEISDNKAHIRCRDLVTPNHLPAGAPWDRKDNAASPEVDLFSDEALPADDNKFIKDEHRAHGGVKARVYWAYIKAGSLEWWFLLVITLLLYRLSAIGLTWFLKQWGEAYGSDVSGGHANDHNLTLKLPSPQENIRPWLLGFFLITSGRTIAFLVSQVLMLVIIYYTGRQMFKDIMHRVAHATFRFYDVTPVGRLMNRLTSDIGTVDGNISQQFQNVAWHSLTFIASIIVIASSTPLFLLFSFLQTLAFVLIFLHFLPTSQSLRRLEMISLSPLMSNFGALLDGLTTVRAFCTQPMFQDRVIEVTDAFQKNDHFYWSVQAWLMYRFDNLAACSSFLLTLIAIFTSVSPGLTAFVLNAAYNLVSATHLLCKQYGQLEMDFVSVERVVELLSLEQEPLGEISPPASWPTFSGDIVFDKVTVNYDASRLDPALEDISFRIQGGENVAVVGRTGSGKSTLALSLVATILPASGHIFVDGIDISKVNKEALRRRITFLAQEPILFPGSMRQNLDPLREFTKEDCLRVLMRVGERFHWTLDTQVETSGKNLSQGERQLIGLARAILRRSPIVIFDEATASIDQRTAVEIQRILSEELAGSTIITIAHRVEAVKYAQRYIVLGNGKLVAEDKITDG